MRTRLFSTIPLILATITTLACGQIPTAPETGTTSSHLSTTSSPTAPVASSCVPVLPPHQDGTSLALIEIVAVTVPPPILYPSPNTDTLGYLPTFVLRETGGVYGATIESFRFTPDTEGWGDFRLSLSPPCVSTRVEAGSQWEFRNSYVDVSEPVAQPLTHLVVRVNFLGDDGKLGAAEGTWTADAASQP